MTDDGKVVSLSEARRARSPHTSGPARCLACGHTFEAVIPCGVSVTTCPACLTERAVRDGLVFTESPHWTCDTQGCNGNQFLHLTKRGAYCPLCGTGWSWEEITEKLGGG